MTRQLRNPFFRAFFGYPWHQKEILSSSGRLPTNIHEKMREPASQWPHIVYTVGGKGKPENRSANHY
jgi:hypothetical protein